MRVHYPPSVRVRWRISADAKPYLSDSELVCIRLFANMGCRNTVISDCDFIPASSIPKVQSS